MPDQVPPGRAGRLWLDGRLASARRGAALLDRKRQLLRRQLEGMAGRRTAAAAEWEAAAIEAERWGRRAVVLGGAAEVSGAADAVAGRAEAVVPWRNTMGVRHPGEPRLSVPDLPPAVAAATNTAVASAAAAYRRAVAAAAEHGALEMSWRVLEAELRATERHLRAIERRRLPALEEALRQLTLRLEELERQERVVTRWAERRRWGAGARTAPGA